jgi:integrase
MTKQRTGELLPRKNGYSVRLWTEQEGEEVRVCVPLNTKNLAVAKARMARLVKGEAPTTTTTDVETFRDAAERIVHAQRDEDGLVSWKNRLQRLKDYCYEGFGDLPVTQVQAEHIRDALKRGLASGKSKDTLRQIKIDCSIVFKALIGEEVLTRNPARDVMIPKKAKRDERPRVILTDEEIERFLTSPKVVDLELKTLSACSRIIGGQRTSDLHDWDWGDIDTNEWKYAWVSRPKTRIKDQHEIPANLVPVLKAWWEAHKRPRKGPVFPVRRGRTVGQKKGKNITYAQKLRDALWAAEIWRPLPGFHETEGEAAKRKLCILQSGSRNERKVDFHSFRRAYSTALAEANVNLQKAMRLAGHRSPLTHMRYVDRVKALKAPEAAVNLRTQKASGMPFDSSGEEG